MIRRCAWCSRCHVDGEWVAVPAPDRADLDVTDGICPECATVYEAKLDELDMLARKEIR